MQKPCCIKCGGDLDHQASSEWWICRDCGRPHRYIEPSPSVEVLELQQLDCIIKDYTRHVEDISQHVTSILQKLECQLGNTHCSQDYLYAIEKLKQKQRDGYGLFDNSLHHISKLIDELQRAYTPIGGGRFELIEVLDPDWNEEMFKNLY